MKYETYEQELMRRWRGVDLPIHETIEVLRAALYLDWERTKSAEERALEGYKYDRPLPE